MKAKQISINIWNQNLVNMIFSSQRASTEIMCEKVPRSISMTISIYTRQAASEKGMVTNTMQMFKL